MNEISIGSKTLGPIACVTVTTADIDAVESCYTQFLDHRVVGRGRISEGVANLWGCEGVADSRYILLSPEAGNECVFRFIESPSGSDPYIPFSTYGWNAAEIMVQNVDAMADRLANSPFKIIGAPANLSFTDDIRAMQILGPGRELLYLTEFKKPIPGLDTPVARCAVDRVFIVILGGPSMHGLQSFYAENFSVPGAPAVDSRVKGMSAAFGNSPEHKYPIAALPLAGQTLIEVDEMPPQATGRSFETGFLPAGIAMVSFVADGLKSSHALDGAGDEPPYHQSGAVTCSTGVAGELIEIIHAADS
jgi:hypothetical protein